MSTSRLLIHTLAGAEVIAATLPASAASYHQKQCKSPHTGAAVMPVPMVHGPPPEPGKQLALSKARQDWSQKALSLYGSSWVYGAPAKVQHADCDLIEGAHPGQDKWSCSYVAAPCKWVSPPTSPNAPGVEKDFRASGALLRRR